MRRRGLRGARRGRVGRRGGALAIACWIVSGVALLGLTAANTVSSSRLDDDQRGVTADGLKPSACAGITVTTLIVGSGTVGGGTTDDLVIGSSGADVMDGRQGTDCILGGGGDDTLRGGPAADVCIGGPGTDTFHATCETTFP